MTQVYWCFRVPDFDGKVSGPMSTNVVYHVSGAGCSEVELDCLTGDVTVRTNLRPNVIISFQCCLQRLSQFVTKSKISYKCGYYFLQYTFIN